jgi:predicted ATPase
MPETGSRVSGSLPIPVEHLSQEGEVSQAQLFESFTQFILGLAQRAPLVVFVDDLQWADSATLDLLQYTVRRWRDCSVMPSSATLPSRARTLLLVSLRSEALHPMTQSQQAGRRQGLFHWLTGVGRELNLVHLELVPLGERETVQMVQSILAPPAADFAQWLYAETLGQPFYLIETMKDFLERRVLRPKRRDGQWTFAVDAEHNLGQAVRAPSTVHAVIRSRLDRLSPHAFDLLVSGAVLEKKITFEHMCAVSNVREDQALPPLDELISGRLLLEAAQPGVASMYAFTNDMLRDVVYTEAGDARRRLFHRRALEILEAVKESAAVLAHHAQAAGLAQATFRHSLDAGREALRLLAVNEAVVHLERAYRYAREASQSEMPDKAELRELYVQLGRAYELGGQAEKAAAVDLERARLG